jgi:hypothetical protein
MKVMTALLILETEHSAQMIKRGAKVSVALLVTENRQFYIRRHS